MAISQLLVASALMFGAAPRGVVYDFTASWCGPCKQMSPVVSRLARQGFPIQKVDVDQHPQFAARYRITSIPAFVLVVDGKEVDRVVGATSEETLRSMLARIPRSQPAIKDRTLLASRTQTRRSSQGRGGRKMAAAKKKPGFHIPFFGKKKEKHVHPDISRATVRANSEDPGEGPREPALGSPMQASVRIRAKSNDAVNYGSGTIISSGNGRTIVLTCGHICRDVANRGSIEVDVFHAGEVKTYLGKVLRFNIKADVGLLEIPTDAAYPHAPIAPLGYQARKGDRVTSVGCGGGNDPTQQTHRIISLNRYLGPDHLECSGEPVEGRSGGGLFSSDGTVIGVCFARDPQDHRGLYAGLKPIQQLLDQCQLSNLYQTPTRQIHETATDSVAITTNEMAPVDPRRNAAPVGLPADGGDAPLFASTTEDDHSTMDHSTMDHSTMGHSTMGHSTMGHSTMGHSTMGHSIMGHSIMGHSMAGHSMADDTMAEDTMAEDNHSDLQRALASAGEAEVVCVLRSLDNPRAASRVVILNRVSEEFVRYLTDELDSDPFNNTTSLKKRSKRNRQSTTRRSTKPPVRENSSRLSSRKPGPRRYRRNRRAARPASAGAVGSAVPDDG